MGSSGMNEDSHLTSTTTTTTNQNDNNDHNNDDNDDNNNNNNDSDDEEKEIEDDRIELKVDIQSDVYQNNVVDSDSGDAEDEGDAKEDSEFSPLSPSCEVFTRTIS